jgi:hypothetical protein
MRVNVSTIKRVRIYKIVKRIGPFFFFEEMSQASMH